jgi:hypothetical protein
MAQKNRQNYFDQSIRQFGEDFIMMLTPEKIQRSAKQRIFREMVQGHIDYSVYGKYFTDPKFFENLLIAAYDELNNNAIIKSALTEFDLHHPGNNLVVVLKGKYTSLEYIYGVIYGRLSQVKASGYNIGYLSDLSAVLYNYRNQI